MKEESEKAGLKLNIQKTKIMACFYQCTASRWGKCGNIVSFHFLEQMVTEATQLKTKNKTKQTNKKNTPSSWKKSYDQPRQHIKKQRHHFADKYPYNASYGFSSNHVWM